MKLKIVLTLFCLATIQVLTYDSYRNGGIWIWRF